MPRIESREPRAERGDRPDRGERGEGMDGRGGRGFGRKKVCRFCTEKGLTVDFKDAGTLKHFVTERGKR